MRGHGGQRGERGSYRDAWAEGNYTRQGLDGESADEDAPTPDVRTLLFVVCKKRSRRCCFDLPSQIILAGRMRVLDDHAFLLRIRNQL